MNDLWGAVVAAVGLLATVIFGVQNDLHSRYERVLALLQELGTGDEAAARHRLGRHVFTGLPELSTDQQASLVEDFFVVASSLQRLRATMTSVDGRWRPGPLRLLVSSTTRMVRFLDQNLEALVDHLAIVSVDDVRADLVAVRQMAVRVVDPGGAVS